LAAIDSGDQNTISDFFTDACVDPDDTTGSACLLFGGLSSDADDRALVAAQLRFVLDNAASQIIADSLDELTDPSLDPVEPMGRIDAVFTAACSSVELPAPASDTNTVSADPTATAEPDATATPAPEPTATPEPDPEPTATPEPDPTATPEPEATAAPEPSATAEPTATATAGASSSDSGAPANLPQTGPGDFTLGLAKTATIILGAGLLFLALEGHAHFRGRRVQTATVTATAAPPALTFPPLKPSADQGTKAELGTLADVRYRDRPSL